MKRQEKTTLHKGKVLNNQGFSLVELMVSIVILAIVIVPLLNNFVISARVSARAKKVQNETILAQSILEDMKTKSILDIESEYADSSGIVPIGSEQIYAKKDKIYHGNEYDVLITLDDSSYIFEDAMNPGGEKIGYNTFKMPMISDIDSGKNIVVVDQYETDMAVVSLYRNHIIYCEEQNKSNKDVVGYHPIIPSNELEIRNSLKRDMSIDITTDGSTIYVKVELKYSCASSILGSDSVSYIVEDKIFTDSMEGIYLFYVPIYSDTLSIRKDSSITREIDIYVVRQTPATVIVSIPEQIIGTIPYGISLYSNVTYGIGSKELVKKESAKSRIYNVKVQLFRGGENFSPEHLCVELNTTKGVQR